MRRPHGAPSPVSHAEDRALSPGGAITIGCYGFMLRDKGLAQLVEAVRLLRPRWPKLRLRLLNADYGNDESREVAAELRTAIRAGNLENAVDLVSDFLPNGEAQTRLSQCDVIVLPYQQSKEGASGALRIALSSGACVAVTPIGLFDDAMDAVVRLPGTDAAAIAQGLETLFQDLPLRSRTREAARRWLADRSWDVVAARIAGMLRGILAAQGVSRG